MDPTTPFKLKQALQTAEDNFRLLADGVRDYAIFLLDSGGKIMSWNSGAERINGFPQDEVLGRDFSMFFTPEDREAKRSQKLLEKARAEGQAEAEGWRVRKDGSTFWAGVVLTALKDDEGNPRGFGILVRDLTENEKTRDEIEKSRDYIWQSEQRFRTLVDAVQDYAIFILDTEGHVASWNTGAQRIKGYDGEEVIGTHFSRFFTPEDAAAGKPQALLLAAEEDGRATDRAWRVRKDGKRFFAEIVITPMYDHEGRLQGFAKVTHDSIARMLLEELKVSKDQLSGILRNLNDAVMVFDDNESLLYGNAKAAEIAGFADEESMRGRSLSEISEKSALMEVNGDPLLEWPARLALSDQPTHRKLSRHRDAKGTEKWFLLGAAPVRDSENQISMAIVTAHDVTELRKTEEALRQSEETLRHAQKMEAIGRLAGGLAHDFNNLLTAINGYTCLVLECFEAGNPMREPLVEIQRAGESAGTLIAQLQIFSRRQVLSPKLLDINRLVSHMETLLRRLIREDVQIETSLAENLEKIHADPGQLEHVIMSLAINARDAMPRGGKLSIQTAQVELDTEAIGDRTGMRPGPHVMLSISDTGMGMDQEVQRHLFEPFFTTKAPGNGTGMGLPLAFAIVEQSGGKIDVYSEPGLGATFNLFFPISRSKDGGDEIDPEKLKGSETVLVVEDDAVLRKMIVQTLRRAGYRVLDAGNGRQALKIVGSGEVPNVVLTDLVMPGMSGSQLAEGLNQICHGLKILFMSGYTRESITVKGILTSQVAFLQKPFSPTLLLQRLRETLKVEAA